MSFALMPTERTLRTRLNYISVRFDKIEPGLEQARDRYDLGITAIIFTTIS